MLLRVRKNPGSSDPNLTAQDLYQAEFTLSNGQADLQLSVYAVSDDPSASVQACVEHQAATLDRPRPFFGALDLEMVSRPAKDDPLDLPEWPFQFTGKAHKVLPSSDEAEVLILVDEFMKAAKANKYVSVNDADVRAFVTLRKSSNHPEWPVFAGKKKWAKLAGP